MSADPPPFQGMERDELNFHRAMYYTAGALWALGLARPALDQLAQLLHRHQVVNSPTRHLRLIEPDLVRPYVK